MRVTISSSGCRFAITDFVSEFGTERYLKLKKHFTISNMNRITNVPIRTSIFKLVTIDGCKWLELPRHAYTVLMTKGMVSETDYDLREGETIAAEYIGCSNSNQQIVVKHVLDSLFPSQSHLGFGGAILNLVAGCHASGTLITMFDGSLKRVESICVGDALMGDDGSKRTVQSLARGHAQMYEISNRFGDSYVVTGDHILCLLAPKPRAVGNTVIWFNNETYKYETSELDTSHSVSYDRVVEISIIDYLSLPNYVSRELLEYRHPVELSEKNVIMEPYKFACLGPQFIPECYKTNSSRVRLSLLTGLIESIGSYIVQDGVSDCVYKISVPLGNARLATDICDLAISLGMPSRIDVDSVSTYVYVYDESHMVALGIISAVSSTSSISVREVGSGDYYGFLLDGNHRYMMGNHVITHNSGKTFVGMDLISKLNKKTLIVVPNTYLLEQWVSVLQDHFPNNSIGMIYGKKKRDGDIVVSIINTASTLSSFDYRVTRRGELKTVDVSVMMKSFGLVIFDEIHLYVSKEFRRIYDRVHAKYTIGLSATPTREDKLHRIAELSVGPIIDAHDISGYKKNNVKFTAKVKLIRYRCLPEYSTYSVRDDGVIDYQSILTQILRDPYRNQMIVDRIIEMASLTNANVFVFSERRSHLEDLYEQLNERLASSPPSSALKLDIPEMSKNIILYGGATSDTIEEAKTVSNIIFTSYAFSSVGVSITKMTGLILCTPRRKKEAFTQIIGRIFRLSDSNQNAKPRHIYDIVDYKLPIKNGYRSRLEVYATRNAEIEYEDEYARE